nr:MAG TPA: hypothetical protein [Caudoviricetes sp.]
MQKQICKNVRRCNFQSVQLICLYTSLHILSCLIIEHSF